MKKIFLVIILLLVSLGLFAEWQIGDFIDDFGDTTGEHFLYCMAEGTFSNSATSNSPCIVRVVANLNNVYLVPYVSKFEFEIHEYNNDNPVQEFYEDSKSIIRIKDDLGKTTSYTESNSKYSNNWNVLYNNDMESFYQQLVSNNLIKVAISCEGTKYNFSIPSDGFVEREKQIRDQTPKKELQKWTRRDLTADEIEINEQIAQLWESTFHKEKNYSIYDWNYYVLVSQNQKYLLLHLLLKDEDYKVNGYPSFSIYTSKSDDKIRFYSDDRKIKQIRLLSGSSKCTLENSKEPIPKC